MKLQEDIQLAVKRARASFRASYNIGRKVDEDSMIARAAIDAVERKLLSNLQEMIAQNEQQKKEALLAGTNDFERGMYFGCNLAYEDLITRIGNGDLEK
jgi:hypothetical protein